MSAVHAVVDNLKSISKAVTTPEEIAQVHWHHTGRIVTFYTQYRRFHCSMNINYNLNNSVCLPLYA